MKAELLLLLSMTNFTAIIAGLHRHQPSSEDGSTTPILSNDGGIRFWSDRGAWKHTEIDPETSPTANILIASTRSWLHSNATSRISSGHKRKDAEVQGDAPRGTTHEICSEDPIENVRITDADVSKEVLTVVATISQLTGNSLDTEQEMTDLLNEALASSDSLLAIQIDDNSNESTLYRRTSSKLTITKFRKTPGRQKEIGLNALPSWTLLFRHCQLDKWVFGFQQVLPSIHKNRSITSIFSVEQIRMNIDQCQPVFFPILGEPLCDPVTTRCRPVENAGFQPHGYKCECLQHFYSQDSNYSFSTNRCALCPDKCSSQWCNFPKQCTAKSNPSLNNIVISVQVSAMGTTFFLMFVVYVNRKCKTIASGRWIILEMILFGCLLLYSTIIFRWVGPTMELCLIEPLCRELGFVICYGSIILKLYRILIEFRTRKAHRWVIRDIDLIKYLCGMIIVVIGYMAAFIANNLNMISKENYSLFTIGSAEDEKFVMCKALWWDYITQAGELLILIFGIHLSFASRNASSQFQERTFLCAAITIEAVHSGAFYIWRYIFWGNIHPDLILLSYFIRSQLTTSLLVILLLAPKWYYQRSIKKRDMSRSVLGTQDLSRTPFEAFKPQDGTTATNSDVEGEINLSEMNPEDIRAELKRLYTQLEVLKSKTICYDNPHISKRRGGRKIAHRRFSLQKKGSREKNLRNQAARAQARQEIEAEPSRTPEDSVCSNEGPSVIFNDGPSEAPATPKKHQK